MSSIMKQKDTKNQIELMDEVEKVWNEVDQKIDNVIDSMLSRIRDWLKQNEERINYKMNSCILIRVIKRF